MKIHTGIGKEREMSDTEESCISIANKFHGFHISSHIS